MITEQRPKQIVVILEEDDFKNRNWKSFLTEFKNLIPWGHRDYDAELKEWRIVDTPHNREIITQLHEKYFIDKEQIQLFGGEQEKK